MANITITDAVVSGDTITLTVGTGIEAGDTVTLDYDGTAGFAGTRFNAKCPVVAFSEEIVNNCNVGYELASDFSQATGQPATLTNAQVLDSVNEGITAGSLTIVGSLATINTNKLIAAGASAAYDVDGFFSQDITLVTGKVFQWKAYSPLQSSYNNMGLFTAGGMVRSTSAYILWYDAVGSRAKTVQPPTTLNGTTYWGGNLPGWNAEVVYTYSIVINTATKTAYLYRKEDNGSHVLITTDTLPTVPATVSFGLNIYSATCQIWDIKVPYELQPTLAAAGGDTSILDTI